MRLLTIAALAALAGCVTSRPVALPNGIQGYAINCPGMDRDIGDCMNRAAEVCGGPYQVVTREESSTGAMVQPVGAGYMMVQGQNRTLLVQCGAGQSDSIQAEIDAFAADPRHPHFWTVREYMVTLLETGQAQSLEDAYQLAILRAGLK